MIKYLIFGKYLQEMSTLHYNKCSEYSKYINIEKCVIQCYTYKEGEKEREMYIYIFFFYIIIMLILKISDIKNNSII